MNDTKSRSCWVGFYLLLALCLSNDQLYAQQFVLFDAAFDYSVKDAETSVPSKSHYYVKGKMLGEKVPKNWENPIDYRNGTVHVRLEILEMPKNDGTTWSICYIPNRGRKNGYGCLGTKPYSAAGVYEQDISMRTFWENESIVWTEGIKQMDLVIKDKNGKKIHELPNPEDYLPTKIRVTLIQVPAGMKYDANEFESLFKSTEKQ